MSRRILIIEDDLIQREVLERMLTGDGYRVLCAPDGQTGLELAAAERPDLIVLDVMMPRLNGYQTARALKRSVETARAPILILTSKDQATDQFWAAEVGAAAFLTKPPEPGTLLRTVRELIGPPA